MDPELLRACENLSVAVGGTLAAKPLLEKLLGPSFDYVGHAMSDLLSRYGNRNLYEIFKRAARKCRVTDTPRYINARVLRAIVEDGSFADDPVAQEYFAGLLAGSLDPEGADDRAITFLGILRNLGRGQLRAHYSYYAVLRESTAAVGGAPVLEGPEVELFIEDGSDFANFGRTRDVFSTYSLVGLAHHALIAPLYDLNAMLYVWSARVNGIVIRGTSLGAELFLWAHNARDIPPDKFHELEFPVSGWEPPFGYVRGVHGQAALTVYRDTIKLLRQAFDACLDAKLDPAHERRLLNAVTMLGRKRTALPSETQDWLHHWRGNIHPLDEIHRHLRNALVTMGGEKAAGA